MHQEHSQSAFARHRTEMAHSSTGLPFFLFVSDLLWSRFVSRTIYLMFPTSIVFVVGFSLLSSRTTRFPQCRQSSVFFCDLFPVFCPLSFHPKFLAALHRDVITYVPQPVMFHLLYCSYKMDFSSLGLPIWLFFISRVEWIWIRYEILCASLWWVSRLCCSSDTITNWTRNLKRTL